MITSGIIMMAKRVRLPKTRWSSRSMWKAPSVLLVLGSLCAASCTYLPSVGPEYSQPQLALPGQWKSVSAQQNQEATALSAKTIGNLDSWWEIFGDQTLNALIEEGQQNSPDLTIARSRLYQARAQLIITQSWFYPSLDSSLKATRSDRSDTGTLFGSAGIPDPQTLYQGGFDASWELDVFGGLRRAAEASTAAAEAEVERYRDTLGSLRSEIVRNYLESRAFQQRITIAARNISLQSDSLRLVQERYRAGLTSQLDVAQAEAQLETTRAALYPLQIGGQSAQHRLAVLLGRQPELLNLFPAEKPPTGEPLFLSKIPATLAAGVPSEVLRFRPDIRAVERELAAATATVGVAIADLYPRFSLSGLFGVESSRSGSLFESGSQYWSIIPGLRWPIFQAGRISANIDLQEQRTSQALAVYEQTVLRALEETENSLTSFQQERLRWQALERSVQANQLALQLSNELYLKGLADFQRVLDSERTLYQAEDQLLLSERNLALSLVAVYKALGGGTNEVSPPAQS